MASSDSEVSQHSSSAVIWCIGALLVIGSVLQTVLLFTFLHWCKTSVFSSSTLVRHAVCYTNGEIIYDHDVIDPVYIGNSVDVYDPELGRRIILTGDVIFTK